MAAMALQDPALRAAYCYLTRNPSTQCLFVAHILLAAALHNTELDPRATIVLDNHLILTLRTQHLHIDQLCASR